MIMQMQINEPLTRNKASEGKMLDCFLAALYLVVMSIQIEPLEGNGVSVVKVAAMCLAPLVLLFRGFFLSRAVAIGTVALVWIFGCMYFQFSNPRIETMGYLAMFIVSFMTFYNLVAKGAFSIDFFLRLIQAILFAYIGVLLLQQIASIGKLAPLPFINLWYEPIPAMKCPSLALEPSHSARIMTAAFYAFLKVSELKNKSPLSIRQLFGNHMLLTCGFIYAMLSMCSGTAVIGLALLSLYFLRKKYVLFLIPAAAALCFFLPQLEEMEQVERVQRTFDAAATFDAEEVAKADLSASFRVIPLINLFKMDFSDKATWLGHGTAESFDAYYLESYLNRVPSNVYEYGLITYVMAQIFIFVCCIPGFFSIATLIYFIMCTLIGFPNMAVFWSVYMIFACVKHFQGQMRQTPSDKSLKNAESANAIFRGDEIS